jgi:hypothetical protein
MAIRGGGLRLPASKAKPTVWDPMAVEHLQEVWVRLVGIPPQLRHADRLLMSTREVGRPIAVEVASL